jgi:glycosyltransferase involved in cell wall biosynthesis
VVVAIPALNEGPTIGSVVLKAKRYADEVVVVDDGSTDDTADVATLAGARVIRHNANKGYGAAIKTCLDYARGNQADILVTMDGDGQHRADMIPRVVQPVAQGEADVSIGSRFLDPHNSERVPRYRRLGIRVITRLTNLGTHHNARIRDAQSGFRAYSRAAIDAIDPVETNMGASAEILWEADGRGLKITEVPVEVDYPASGSSHGPVRHGMSVIGSMVRYVETKHALLFFGVPGLGTFLAGLVLGFYVVESFYRTTQLAVGLALVTVLLIVLGMLLTFTGVIIHAVINANRYSRWS